VNEGPLRPPIAVTYAQWLASQIEPGVLPMGAQTAIVNTPTLIERMFPVLRPNHALEARLEARLREPEAEVGR
jgi:hypothetical protein